MFNEPGSPITLDFQVYDSDDVLVDASSVSFWWRIGRTGVIERGTTPSSMGTGLYRVTFVPDQGGTVFWRFEADTPDFVFSGIVYVEEDVWDQARTGYS